MTRFKFQELEINDVFEISNMPLIDERGYLTRLFCCENFHDIGSFDSISQVNRTFTKNKGTIRGMHFQNPPASESKIIICLKGEIMDVAIDVRKNSKTFLKHVSLRLNNEKNNMILIPKGFAHGFQTLTDNVELLYFHDHKYSPVNEKGINPFDPEVGINWPIKKATTSKKDKEYDLLKNYKFEGI